MGSRRKHHLRRDATAAIAELQLPTTIESFKG
jgi:hypothetical protein